MRELPEPDGEFYSWANQYRVQSKQGWSKESVLAIQKQAYEDGLRDAIKCADEQWVHNPNISGGDAIRAMLTASQEKK